MTSSRWWEYFVGILWISTSVTASSGALGLSRPGTHLESPPGRNLVSLEQIQGDPSRKTKCGASTSWLGARDSGATVSFLSKIRTKIHTTPGLRQVSQTWANTFGMSKAYAEYDKKIGITDSGEPVPAAVTQFSPTFDRTDLAAYATDNYPNAAMLVGHYRQFQGSRPVRTAMPAVYPGDLEEEPGFNDGDENLGEFYDDDEEEF
jgi:hypothetical protein